MKVHCFGGFVLVVMCALPRATGDVDFICIDPSEVNDELLRIAGERSDLAKRHKLKFQRVDIADKPEAYASRLIDITPPSFQRLHLLGFEVHDLVLTKLARFSPRDRQDVEFLVRAGALDRGVLEQRFEEEVRPYLLKETPYADNLRLRLAEYFRAVDR